MNQNNLAGWEEILTGTATVVPRTPAWDSAGNWTNPTEGAGTTVAALWEPLSQEEQQALPGPFQGAVFRVLVGPQPALSGQELILDGSGARFEIVGKPKVLEDPFTGHPHHQEIVAMRRE